MRLCADRSRSLPLALSATLLLCAGGCGEGDQSTYIAPFDGQTDWPVGQPLEVALPNDALPPDYPLDQGLLRVVDLTNGGLVEGDVVHDGRRLRFYPTDGWAPSTDYAWTLSAPVDRNREPHLMIPPGLLGDATFSTTARLELVDAVERDDELCLLLSRAFDDDVLRIYLDGVRGADWSIVEVTVGGVEDVQTKTLHALCAPEAGVETVRFEVGDSAVYQLTPDSGGALSGFRSLHRVVDP